MKKIIIGSYVLWTFLLSSFLWVTGLYDTSDYVIYKGLIALVVDHLRDFVIVVIPLSILSVWSAVRRSRSMNQKRIKGLWIIADVTLFMTMLGILLNIVNLYSFGPPGETFAGKTSFFIEFAPVMVLSKLIMGAIFGLFIGLSLFVFNLLLARLLVPAENA